MIDLTELEEELKTMKPRQKFYETVKRVLEEQGRWKNRPRGWAFKEQAKDYRRSDHRL